jgi:hypothetical protein
MNVTIEDCELPPDELGEPRQIEFPVSRTHHDKPAEQSSEKVPASTLPPSTLPPSTLPPSTLPPSTLPPASDPEQV